MNLELTDLQGWLASELQESFHLSFHHGIGIVGMYYNTWSLPLCWGAELRSSDLCNKHFTYWAISPALF